MIQNDVKGIKAKAYELLSKGLGISGQYRTYDYMTAKKSAVYLEPIRIFTEVDDEDYKKGRHKILQPTSNCNARIYSRGPGQMHRHTDSPG